MRQVSARDARAEVSHVEHDPVSLRIAVSAFVRALDAATVPSAEGRLVPDLFGALVLSEAADRLYRAVAEALQEESIPKDRASDLPPGFRLEHSDSPSGPWKPIPKRAMRVRKIRLKKGDPHVAGYGALMRAAVASGFPATLWNRLQAANAYHPKCCNR